MRRLHRIVVLAALLAMGAELAACSDFDMDKLDVFGLTDKKKLPGERKELFPGGVPGVTQGVPPEYMQGYQPPPDAGQTPLPGSPDNAAGDGTEGAPKAAAAQPAPGTQPGAPQAAPKAMSRTAAIEPVERIAPKGAGMGAAEPKPKAKAKAKAKAKKKTQTVQQPANGAQPMQPWPSGSQPPAQQAPATSPWPSAPPPGSFTH
jgi:hypothetical protein